MNTEANEVENVEAEAAPAKEPRTKNETQNGVSKPASGTKTGRVWEIADEISALKQRPALREEVMGACEEEGINRGTIATQYARWTQFYGVTKEDRQVAREAAKPPKPVKEKKGKADVAAEA